MNTRNLIGWIEAQDELTDREHLKSLGIKVGSWKVEDIPGTTGGTFKDCEVSLESLEKLEPFFGKRYIWGLS